MSLRTTASIAALAALLLAPSAYAMPMSGTITGHVDSQKVQPMGSAEKLKIDETASGTNAGPGTPLDGAQISISEIVTLNKGQGPSKGTITFTTPTGTTTSPYTAVVATDAQGRVTAKGKFTTTGATGAFEGLRGSGTFTNTFTSKTDFTSEWKGNFKPPKMARH